MFKARIARTIVFSFCVLLPAFAVGCSGARQTKNNPPGEPPSTSTEPLQTEWSEEEIKSGLAQARNKDWQLEAIPSAVSKFIGYFELNQEGHPSGVRYTYAIGLQLKYLGPSGEAKIPAYIFVISEADQSRFDQADEYERRKYKIHLAEDYQLPAFRKSGLDSDGQPQYSVVLKTGEVIKPYYKEDLGVGQYPAIKPKLEFDGHSFIPFNWTEQIEPK